MTDKIDFAKIMKALNPPGSGPGKPGDYCEIDEQNPHIVNLYHEDGTWFMSMPLEDYEDIKKYEPVSGED